MLHFLLAHFVYTQQVDDYANCKNSLVCFNSSLFKKVALLLFIRVSCFFKRLNEQKLYYYILNAINTYYQ